MSIRVRFSPVPDIALSLTHISKMVLPSVNLGLLQEARAPRKSCGRRITERLATSRRRFHLPCTQAHLTGLEPPVVLVVSGHGTPVCRLALGVARRHPGTLPPAGGHQLRQLHTGGFQILGHPDAAAVSGEPVAEACGLGRSVDSPADSPKIGAFGSGTPSSGLMACRAGAAARPMYRTDPSASWSVLDWGM